MLRLLRRPAKNKSKKQIKDIIHNQKLLDAAIDERMALAGINKANIPYRFKERIVMLPPGRIHCVGAGTTLELDRGAHIYRCNEDMLVNDKDHIIVTSQCVIIEESIKDNKISVWYAV